MTSLSMVAALTDIHKTLPEIADKTDQNKEIADDTEQNKKIVLSILNLVNSNIPKALNKNGDSDNNTCEIILDKVA